MLTTAKSGIDRWSLIAIGAVLLGVATIVATYRRQSQTFDEGVHVAAGLEWIDRGSYTLERHTAPLTRLPVAIGPYLDGVRLTPGVHNLSRRFWSQGDSVFFQGTSYTRTLTLARLGSLPFYFLLAWVVWLWGTMLLGRPGAAIATALVALTPTVLAHAGLATTDVGLTATFLLTLYALIRWLEAPTTPRAALFGAASGLAVAAKFSAFPYIGLSLISFAAWRVWHLRTGTGEGTRGSSLPGLREWRERGAPQLLAAFVCCFVVVWAAYRFSIIDVNGFHVPAGELVIGFRDALAHSTQGHYAYLLGERSKAGWWYYFPIALAVKTPLVLLVLGAVGMVVTMRQWRADWRIITPVLALLAVFLTGVITHINIGVRHVLPVYAAWAVLAAAGVIALWRPGRREAMRRSLVAMALLWFTIDVVRETPHHLAYFNEVSRSNPAALLVDSNLDWGQDMLRLSDELERRGIRDVSVSLLARPVFGKLTSAHVRQLRPREQATGWVAASETCLRNVYPTLCGPFEWLDGVQPVTRVGRSILLYEVPSRPARVAAADSANSPR